MSDTEDPIETISESTRRTLQHQADRIRELLASLAAVEAQRDKLGNELAQERSRPGGSFDQWARLQATEEVVDAARFVIEKEELHHEDPSDEWWRTRRPFWMYRLRESVRALAQSDVCPSCKPGGSHDIHFDRTLCACGSMHYYCNECGRQTDPCDDRAVT